MRDFGNWQNRPAATTQAYLKMRQEVDAALAGRADRPAALRRAEAWAKHGNISPQEYEELVGLIERLH